MILRIKGTINTIATILLLLPMLAACRDDDAPVISLGIDDSYTIPRMQKLFLTPALSGEEYVWSVEEANGSWKTLSASRRLTFVGSETGAYHLRIEIVDSDESLKFDFTVNVVDEEIAYSPYITRVLEYCPAPGQFVNKLPWYDEGDTAEDMRLKAEESISGTNDELVTLGAYGGYITFGFDHTVVNVEGEYDFMVYGNAFYDISADGEKAGSCEPGIVMVSLDTNGNGLPDDEWFELAGSEYNSAATTHLYTITYSAPDAGKAPVPEGRYLADAEYIPWHDSLGNFGYVAKNYEHSQSYYPLWLDDVTLSFTGTLLAPNAEDVYGDGSYYKLHSYAWGYVDNHPNEIDDLNSFDIGWAVDRLGMPVRLPGIDFVRVATGINQYCGRLGETSTEVTRARDLHVD